MKTITKIIFSLIVLLSMSTVLFAQKTASVGVKVGFPNLIGGNAEVVLPLLNNRISVYGDLSKINRDFSEETGEDVAVDFNYTEFGANYYLGSRIGRGFYLGAGKGNFKLNGTISNVELDGGRTGEGSATIKFNTTNFKLGVKTGGMIYVRFEAGLGFGEIPTEVQFVARSSDGYTETVTENFEEDLKSIPGFSDSGIGILNFGVGFSF